MPVAEVEKVEVLGEVEVQGGQRRVVKLHLRGDTAETYTYLTEDSVVECPVGDRIVTRRLLEQLWAQVEKHSKQHTESSVRPML